MIGVIVLASACGHTSVLSADFRNGLPEEWTVQSGILGVQVEEIREGIRFSPQPPNQPKGSIVHSESFQTTASGIWTFSAVTKGTGGGGGWVDWHDENGQTLGAFPFAEGVSDEFTLKTVTLQAPPEARSWRVWFGVDTFGYRILQSLSISSTPSN